MLIFHSYALPFRSFVSYSIELYCHWERAHMCIWKCVRSTYIWVLCTASSLPMGEKRHKWKWASARAMSEAPTELNIHTMGPKPRSFLEKHEIQTNIARTHHAMAHPMEHFHTGCMLQRDDNAFIWCSFSLIFHTTTNLLFFTHSLAHHHHQLPQFSSHFSFVLSPKKLRSLFTWKPK